MKFISHDWKKKQSYSQDELQNRDSVLCGYWCLYYLNERQKGKSVLDVIYHPDFDENNRDFIIEYFVKDYYKKIIINYFLIKIKT